MGKKWKNGDFGINSRTCDVYNLLSEHFPTMFPRLTKLRKTFSLDEKKSQRPNKDETIVKVLDDNSDVLKVIQEIDNNGGRDIKVIFQTKYQNCTCDYDCYCKSYIRTGKIELVYVKQRILWEQEEARWQELNRLREEQEKANLLNGSFNKIAIENNRNLINMAMENLVYWRASNKAINLDNDSELKRILAEDLKKQLHQLEGDENGNDEVSDERAVDGWTRKEGDAS